MRRLLFFLFIFLFTSTAFAVRVNSIYRAEIPVSSQSVQERDQAVLQGLSQVLIKVSGKPTILNNPTIKSHLTAAAANLMQEYSYTENLLKVSFDQNGVNKLLKDANSPIWGTSRPLIVAWIQYQGANQAPQIIDSHSGNEIQALLKQNSDRYGLPVLLPMMDVTDLNQLSGNDVANMRVDNLQSASKRYGNDAILVMNISQQNHTVTAQSKLVLGKESWGWNSTGDTVQNVLNSLMDKVSETLVARYSTVVTNVTQKNITLKITGVNQQTDFAELIHYIQNIAFVDSVQPAKISGDAIELSISLRGSQEAFVQAISLDKKLTPTADNSNTQLLIYEWNHQT